MENTLKLIVLAFLTLISSCKNKEEIESELKMEVETTGLQFKHADFNSAMDSAKEQDKPLLVYVTSNGCLPCFKMQKEVFSDSEVY